MTPPNTDDIETQHITLTVADGTAMPAYVARPTGNRPKLALLVFQEAFGVNAHIRDVTERFAREGYTAIAPALFHRTDANFEGSYTDFGGAMPHMQALTEEGLGADARAAFDWLMASDGGQAEAVGSIGYCLGGRVSFLANALLPLKAAVSYYGGGIAPSERGPGLLQHTENLHAPILLFWGGQDGHIGPEQRRAIEDALRTADKTYAEVTFSQAGHGFFCDVRDAYEPNAARQSWALTLAFFDSFLKP